MQDQPRQDQTVLPPSVRNRYSFDVRRLSKTTHLFSYLYSSQREREREKRREWLLKPRFVLAQSLVSLTWKIMSLNVCVRLPFSLNLLWVYIYTSLPWKFPSWRNHTLRMTHREEKEKTPTHNTTKRDSVIIGGFCFFLQIHVKRDI